jgi:hypothetical protein
MSQQNHETVTLNPLEAALVRNLRRTALDERELLLELSKLYAEMFPARPALRLVKSSN